MSGQHRLAPSPELRKHWRLVRGMLVALIAGLGLGSWWLMTATGAPAPKQPAAHGMDGNWPSAGLPATTAPATTPQPPTVTTATSAAMTRA